MLSSDKRYRFAQISAAVAILALSIFVGMGLLPFLDVKLPTIPGTARTLMGKSETATSKQADTARRNSAIPQDVEGLAVSLVRATALIALTLAATACSSGLSATQCNAALSSWNQAVERYSRYRNNVGYLKNYVLASTPPPASANGKGHILYTVAVATMTGDALMEKPYVESAVLSVFPPVQRGLQDIQTDVNAFLDRLDDTKMFDGDNHVWTRAQDGSGYVIGFDPPGKTANATWQQYFGEVTSRMASDYQTTFASMKQEYADKCGGAASEVRSADDF